jgi:hypothetical protein
MGMVRPQIRRKSQRGVRENIWVDAEPSVRLKSGADRTLGMAMRWARRDFRPPASHFDQLFYPDGGNRKVTEELG